MVVVGEKKNLNQIEIVVMIGREIVPKIVDTGWFFKK
jgi:hypothetical protein